nr:Chain B, Peptidase [Shewanella oneidensis]3NJN_D Chain D, Peptidase [Shewanella oneidensis]
PAIINRPQN